MILSLLVLAYRMGFSSDEDYSTSHWCVPRGHWPLEHPRGQIPVDPSKWGCSSSLQAGDFLLPPHQIPLSASLPPVLISILPIQSLQMDPDNGFAKVHYGFIVKSIDHQYEDAIPYLREGIDSNASGVIDGRFFFHLGDALHRTGKPAEVSHSWGDLEVAFDHATPAFVSMIGPGRVPARGRSWPLYV